MGRITTGTMVELVEVTDRWAKVIIRDGKGARVGWVYKPALSPLKREP